MGYQITMQFLTKLTVPCLLLMLAGCGNLSKDTLSLEEARGCPRGMNASTLLARSNDFGPESSTKDLQCALNAVRNSHDPALLRSPLASRICLNLAERDEDPGTREKLASEGVRFAEQAIAQGANTNGAVHYYLASNLGLAVRSKPALAAENMSKLEQEAKLAVQLSPDLDGGGPLRLLGMLYLKAPPWPAGIGDGDKALELLKQAVDHHPEHPLNHLFYAQALFEVDGDAAKAKAQSEYALGLAKLKEGQWGFAKAAWLKESEAIGKEIGSVTN